jgi:tripartite-type tricarboxylate transporter receptor subunit TctC
MRYVKLAAFITALLAGTLAAGAALSADPYPAKPVRIIVATGPGGVDDFTARQVASQLGEVAGQQFIVENRAGAGGMIAQTYVAKSPPDGYTLLLAGGSMAGAKYVNANITYDLLRDFTPVSLLSVLPFAVVMNPALPVRNVQEFVELARARPGKLTYGTLGAGQIPYWGAVLFNTMGRMELLEVQYKNPADAITDIIAGRLDYYITGLATVAGSRDKVHILAVTSAARSQMLPDIPAIAETLPGYDMPAWQSIMGPAGMSGDIVQILSKAIARSLANPELRERFQKAGMVPSPSSPEELRKRYADWMLIFGRIAQDAGVKPR